MIKKPQDMCTSYFKASIYLFVCFLFSSLTITDATAHNSVHHRGGGHAAAGHDSGRVGWARFWAGRLGTVLGRTAGYGSGPGSRFPQGTVHVGLLQVLMPGPGP